jgi:hypothetical protein
LERFENDETQTEVQMSDRPLLNMLAGFEDALDFEPAQYEPLIAAFRELEVPADVTDAELTRLYSICFAILGIEPTEHAYDIEQLSEDWQIQHLVSCAREVLESTMFDRNAETRQWIVSHRQGFLDRGQELPDGCSDDQLPPLLTLPWDEETALARIRPFLDRYELFIKDQPLFHLPLCWNVLESGYPVFVVIVKNWLQELEDKRLGPAGTVAALDLARELHGRATPLHDLSWDQVSSELLPLLQHAHGMVAAGAARYLGELYQASDPEAVLSGKSDWPALSDLLDAFRTLPKHRAAVAGGFICGWDSDAMEGMGGLRSHPALTRAGFDFDQWVLDILAPKEEESYLPNAQSFWFYVHECYDYDAAFCQRLLAAGHDFVALMCATEADQPVQGMADILEHLARSDDPQIADAAQHHLHSVYTD